jgi:mRNA-degrading endonuclease toxin of MazEF toxin-antitoxin module
VAVFNQIRSVDRSRLIKKLGEAGPAIMRQADEAVRAAFGLPGDRNHRI